MDLPSLRFGDLELWMATAQKIDLDDVCPNFRVYTHTEVLNPIHSTEWPKIDLPLLRFGAWRYG